MLYIHKIQNELLNEARKLALSIAKNGQNAVRNSKKAINDGLQLDIEKAIKIEEKLFGDCFQSDEQVDRMKKFLEKGKNKKQDKSKNLRESEEKKPEPENKEETKEKETTKN